MKKVIKFKENLLKNGENALNYDIFQIILHSLGFITEYLESEKYKNIKSVTLINSVWKIGDISQKEVIGKDYKIYENIVENEFKAYEKYQFVFDKLKEIYKMADPNLNLEFKVLDWKDFKDAFKLSEERKDYLGRYCL